MARDSWKETEKIPIPDGPYRGSVPDREFDEEDDNDNTKPHALPVLSLGNLDAPATGHDVLALWERIDRFKSNTKRARRSTDNQVSGDRAKLASIAFKIRIIWAIGALILAGTGASLVGVGKFLYGRGSLETETAITLRTLGEATTELKRVFMESSGEQNRRLRSLEDEMIKFQQRMEDRRYRLDVTDPSTRGKRHD